MSRAAFDATGLAVLILRGVAQAPSGTTVKDVPDGTSPNDIYLLSGNVVQRQAITPTASGTTIVADGVDSVTLGGFPAGAWISINGVNQALTAANSVVKSSTVAQIRISTIGRYRADDIVINAVALSDMEATLVGQVNAERERRQALLITDGTAKKLVYSAKQSEVEAWNNLGGTATAILAAFNLLTPTVKNRRFRYTMQEVAITGDTAATVVARFQAAADGSTTQIARLEAIAQKGVTAIRAANTAAAKRAAYAAVNWNA